MKNFPIAIFALTLGAFSIGMTEFVIMGLLPNVANDLHVSISASGQLITGYETYFNVIFEETPPHSVNDFFQGRNLGCKRLFYVT